MGDIQKLMPLYSLVFNNLIDTIGINVLENASLPFKEQLSIAAPNKTCRKMCAMGENFPTEARIIQDVEDFVSAVTCIIQEKGGYVYESYVRCLCQKESQKAVKGGSIMIIQGRVLMNAAEVGISQLEERWDMLTKS